MIPALFFLAAALCMAIALMADKIRRQCAQARRLRHYLAQESLKTRLMCLHVNAVQNRRHLPTHTQSHQ